MTLHSLVHGKGYIIRRTYLEAITIVLQEDTQVERAKRKEEEQSLHKNQDAQGHGGQGKRAFEERCQGLRMNN